MEQTLVMTGASRGLGRNAAIDLLRRDPELHLIVTSRGEDATRLAADLAANSGNPHVSSVHADLASLASVRAAVDSIRSKLAEDGRPPLRGFIGNAGLQFASGARSSADGIEATFAVNVLANYVLVESLLPLMTAPARIVLTTSDTHFGDFGHNMGMPAPAWTSASKLARPGEDTTIAGRTAYTTSKLALIYLTHAFARQLPQDVDVFSFNPGLVPGTGLVRDGNAMARGLFRAVMPALRLTSKAQSPLRAGEQLAALARGDVTAPSGSYVNKTEVEPSSDASFDRTREDDVWLTCSELSSVIDTTADPAAQRPAAS